MSKSARAAPIFLSGDSARKLRTVSDFSEAFIQDLLFRFPESLPVREIDDAFVPLVPVCTELNTPVGPLDVLYVTPRGRLAIAEAKLWRNPEARRRVVAQILDYAKELARWDYEDLQREVRRRTGSTGNVLYQLANGSGGDAEVDEAVFVDAVSRNLQHGRFLLLIVGDGIREGAAGLADFLATAGHLEFSLAMVELAVYDVAEDQRLIVPRILAQTIELQRVIVEVPDGLRISATDAGGDGGATAPPAKSPEWDREKVFYRQFWREFVESLELDDPGQPAPGPANAQNLYLYLPTRQGWISAYFSKSSKRVGVYFRCGNTQLGHKIRAELSEEREAIERELSSDRELRWNMEEEGGGAGVRMPCDDVFSPENRPLIMQFFREWVNRFVNSFRPRLKRIEAKL